MQYNPLHYDGDHLAKEGYVAAQALSAYTVLSVDPVTRAAVPAIGSPVPGNAIMPALAMLLGDCASGTPINPKAVGLVKNFAGSWNWTPGKMLFLSKDVAGELVEGPVEDYFTQPVAVAVAPDTIYFNPGQLGHIHVANHDTVEVTEYGCLDFHNFGAHGKVYVDNALHFSGDFTLSFLIYPRATIRSFPSTILYRTDSWYIRMNGEDLEFVQGTEIVSLCSVSMYSWTHIIITGNSGTGLLQVYQDGSPVETDLPYTPLSSTSGKYLYIGNDEDLHTPFDGRIDEINAWHRELDSTEVSEVFNNPYGNIANPPWDDSCDAIWHFDEILGTVFTDSTGNIVDGTLSETTWIRTEYVAHTYDDERDVIYGPAPIVEFVRDSEVLDPPPVVQVEHNTDPDRLIVHIPDEVMVSNLDPTIYGSLVFGGDGPYGVVGDAGLLNIPGTDFTISFWAKPTGRANGMILQKMLDGAPNFYEFLDVMVNNGEIKLFSYDEGGIVATGVYLDDDVWNHIVITGNNSTELVQVYKNGVHEGVDISFAALVSTPTGATYFGNNYDQSYGFTGALDEINIWTRELNASEVTTLYNAGVGVYGDTGFAPWDTGIHAIYHFDECTGTDFYNSGGSRYDGSVTGTTWLTTEHVPCDSGFPEPKYYGPTPIIQFVTESGDIVPMVEETDPKRVVITLPSGGGGGTRKYNQLVTPDPDGRTTEFTVPDGSYIAGTLQVFVNGVLQLAGSGLDYEETDPDNGLFEFMPYSSTIPNAGEMIRVHYEL